ncbi:hypothetical protein NJ7G_1576 [Natrinema sp. J7-2]|uniref:Uncharacterized protein n=1 Tax=Natrinema gari JCM 14663 TaxID=1230459 RepID=L9Z7G1_9EURY|nr:hypothetical protein NJ7G_1576 [Natrinema sp. J7-2]ELY82304.1 hypothetical protein C486_04945 [Natrinema gari JCM 14663]
MATVIVTAVFGSERTIPTASSQRRLSAEPVQAREPRNERLKALCRESRSAS